MTLLVSDTNFYQSHVMISYIYFKTAGITMENTQKSQVEALTSQNEHAPSNDGIAMPIDSQQHGQTHLVAPGPVASTDLYCKMNFHDVPTQQNLLNYLSRPTIEATGLFGSGAAGPFYDVLYTPSNFTSTVPNTFGAYGMRATVCFRLEVAAAPQAQGIIRLAYEYLPYVGSLSKGSYRALSAQLPGAEINLRSASSVEVKIPFVSDRNFWPISNGTYINSSPAFRFCAYAYAPVAWDTTTVSTPSWILYKWYEDVELISSSTPTVAVTPQAGRSVEDDVSKVSTWFRLGSRVAALAGTVPTLSSIAAPVSWALSTASKVAAHYGWSKPNEGSYMGVVGRSYARGINTCADSDFANPLGYYSNNEVAVLPGFAGSSVDEMSLCYLTCKPGLIAACNLQASDVRDSIKWTTLVTPSCFVFQSPSPGFAQLSAIGLGTTATSGNKPGYFPSPVAYFASHFERWRGDLIFRFKFNTTKFHAGKILIGYVPGEDVSDGLTAGGFAQAPPPNSRYDFQSAVIDLRNTTEYDFVVPFTYPAAWCNTGMLTSSTSSTFSVPNTGSVFVRILDPLYGPDNVVQTADMLVEVLGTCGLEFTQPISSFMLPLDTSTPPVVIAQAGMDSASDDACTYATGEQILSVKQLMARPYWITTANTLTQGQILPANLAYWQAPGFVAGSTYFVPYPINDTVVNRFQCCYALVRGGLVARFLPQLVASSELGPGTHIDKPNAVSILNWAPNNTKDLRSCGLSIETDMVNQVRIPYYGKNTRSRTSYNTRLGADPQSTNRTLWTGLGDADSTFAIFGLSAADDFQLGAFTGVPPCVTYESTSSYTPTDQVMYRKGAFP